MQENFIPLARPDIQEPDIQAVIDVLLTGMLVQGPKVEALEKQMCSWSTAQHAIAASNGTATLHMALTALKIGPGDEVIVPAFSYIATANAVEVTGAKVVFADIDLRTFNISVSSFASCITPQTKAVIPVHEFGMACDIEDICAIANQYKIFVIEDAACALGAHYKGKPVGTFGNIGSFSLHPRKSITSGEGGLLTTADHSLARALRQLRNHGIEIEEGVVQFKVAGFNYRMTDFQAALASSQFERLHSILNQREQLASMYRSEIRHNAITLPIVADNRNHTWQTYHLLLADDVDRNKVITYLKNKGIGTNYGAQCIPEQQYYLNKYNLDAGSQFPNARKAYRQGLAIPLYERLSENDIRYVCKTINSL